MDMEKMKININAYGCEYTSNIAEDASVDDMLMTIYGMMCSIGYSPIGVLENMKEFAEERLKSR
jgi:hypothetical protein